MDDAQEQRVRERVAQLQACRGDYHALDEEQAGKRLAWWAAHREMLALNGPLPRQAYTLFLLRYLRLDAAEVSVVYEDERRIVWRSLNFCPTLAACVQLGLDTRTVCRAGTEGSVQVLIACLDPRLRFTRDYVDGIRPYAPYCEESIQLVG
jgi:tRNA(adenine34) deaminase